MFGLKRSAWIRNLQVATAGEDEEDLRVVDGQQRTAGRDDEHGCALNTTGSARLRIEKIKKKKKTEVGRSISFFISAVQELTAGVFWSLLSRCGVGGVFFS